MVASFRLTAASHVISSMSMSVELLLFILVSLYLLWSLFRRRRRFVLTKTMRPFRQDQQCDVASNTSRREASSPSLAFTTGVRAPRNKDRKRRLPTPPPPRLPTKGVPLQSIPPIQRPLQILFLTESSVWSECHPDILANLQRHLMQDLRSGPKTLQNCRLVNRHWYRELCGSMQELTPRLRVFTFWDLDALRRFRNLKKLTLRDDSIVSDSWLHELPKVVPRLEALVLRVLSDSTKKSAMTSAGIDSILQLEQLRHLEVAASGFNSTEAIKKLARNRRLTYLDLSENGLHYHCIQELTTLTNLENLILGGNPSLGDSSLKLMTGFPKLRHLGFRSSRWVSDLGIGQLGSMTSLTSLDVRMCDAVNGVGFAECKGVPLTRLDLMCCSSLDDINLQYLTLFRFLKLLDVRMCPRISDKGLEILKQLPSLVDLRLGAGRPNVTDKGLESIVHLPCLEKATLFFLHEITIRGLELVCGMETLKKLTVVQCRSIAVPQAMDRLTKARPELTIDVFPYTGPM